MTYCEAIQLVEAAAVLGAVAILSAVPSWLLAQAIRWRRTKQRGASPMASAALR